MEQTVHYFERQTPMKQKKMKIKNVAIYLILTLSLSLSIEVSLLLSQQTKDPAEEMDYVSQDTNATLCTYLKQFKLSGSKRISVCAYNHHVRVDIRRFIDDKATIQGIWINSEEWLALIRLQGKINLSMTFAKNN